MKTIDSVRSLREGHGVKGVQLNLSMEHIYSLQMLQQECKSALELEPDTHPAYHFAEQVKAVLDFIICDIPSPFSGDLWKIEQKQ